MLFPRQWEVQKWKFEQNLKIWKSEMAATCDVIYLATKSVKTNQNKIGIQKLMLWSILVCRISKRKNQFK